MLAEKKNQKKRSRDIHGPSSNDPIDQVPQKEGENQKAKAHPPPTKKQKLNKKGEKNVVKAIYGHDVRYKNSVENSQQEVMEEQD